MNQAKFPEMRKDGTSSVASRFAVDDKSTAQRVADYVAGWVHGITATGRVNLLDDLSSLPRVVGHDAFIDIVFDSRPGSKRWKDWMVYLTRDIQASIGELSLEGFHDLVAGRPHPALQNDMPQPP